MCDTKLQKAFRSHLLLWYKNRDVVADPKQVEFYISGAARRFTQMFGVPAENIKPLPARILDVGCGFGHLALYMATTWPGATVRARDVDSRYFEVGRQTAKDLGLSNVEFAEQKVQEVTRDDRAELVVASNMLNFFPKKSERKNVYMTLAEVTVSGGVLGLYFPHFWTLREAFTGVYGLQLAPHRVQDAVARRLRKRSTLSDVHSPAISEVTRALRRHGLVLQWNSCQWPATIRSPHVGMFFKKP